MITKQDFNLAGQRVLSDLSSGLPKMMSYKSSIQRAVLNRLTNKEMEDIRDSRINQEVIDKLCNLAKGEWRNSGDAFSLYCAAMAVGTIVKEYEWGTQYVAGEGLWEIANRIQTK